MKPDKYRTSDKALAAYLIYFDHTHVGTGMPLSNPKVTLYYLRKTYRTQFLVNTFDKGLASVEPKKYAEILKKI